MRLGKEKIAKFTILVRNNFTKKHKSTVFDAEIDKEEELLNLIKDLLIKYYKRKDNRQ